MLAILGAKIVRNRESKILREMMNAMAAFAQSVETGEVLDRPDLSVSIEEMNDLMDFGFLTDLEQLSRHQLENKYGAALVAIGDTDHLVGSDWCGAPKVSFDCVRCFYLLARVDLP